MTSKSKLRIIINNKHDPLGPTSSIGLPSENKELGIGLNSLGKNLQQVTRWTLSVAEIRKGHLFGHSLGEREGSRTAAYVACVSQVVLFHRKYL